MVTLANTQNFSQFELHARAILGLSIPEISLSQNGASAVILASAQSDSEPEFNGFEAAALIPKSDFKIFGKPTTRSYRRMGVALAYGTENVEELIEKAKLVASKITVK